MEGTQEEESHAQRMARLMRETGERIIKTSGIIENQAETIRALIALFDKIKSTGKGKILVLGWGRSGFMGKAFAMRLMHLGFEVYVIGETIAPGATPDDLVIVVSGSGMTDPVVAELQRMIREAETIKIIAFTSRSRSITGRLADLVIKVAGREEAADTTKQAVGERPSLATEFETNVLAVLDAFVQELKLFYKITEEEMQQRHA